MSLLALCAIAALQSLYAAATYTPGMFRSAELAALDLAQPGSLASWFASMLLAVSAAVSVMIFHLRRHKLDDYRAFYRMWIPSAALLMFASVDATAGLHRLLPPLMQHLTGSNLFGGGAVWSVLVLGALFGVAAVRMAIEIRFVRGALSMLGVAVTLYAVASLFTIGVVSIDGGLLAAMTESTLLLLAHATLVSSLVLYLRHVYLDAQGKAKARSVRRKRVKRQPTENKKVAKKSNDKPASRESRSARTPAAEPTRKQPARPVQPDKQTEPVRETIPFHAADDDESEESGSGPRKLTKAERRRMRKQQRRLKQAS